MTFGSRQKGAVAENEVAKLFEAWWRKLEPECVFKRTPLSGGWSSPVAREHFKTSGDLVTSAVRCPFTVEVKRREGWDLERLLDAHHPQQSKVWGWWLQAQAQGKEQGAEPLLLLRKSREPWRLMMRASYARDALPNLMDAVEWDRWPRSRGHRPVFFHDAGFLFDLSPLTFALPEAVTSVRRRHVHEGREPRAPR
jgi:hypothetical protein